MDGCALDVGGPDISVVAVSHFTFGNIPQVSMEVTPAVILARCCKITQKKINKYDKKDWSYLRQISGFQLQICNAVQFETT